MSRRRLVNSYFYIMYNNQRVKKGGTVTLSPFEATGGTDSFTVYSSRNWTMGQKPAWLSTSVESGKRGVTNVTVTATTNSGAERNGSTKVGPTYFLDSHYITLAFSQAGSDVDYRNLRVEPTTMSLNTSDLTNGKIIRAYVDKYVNGVFDSVVEVTFDASWSSQNTSVAVTEVSSNDRVVKPVYGAGSYYPDTRTTTVTASYLGSAATCSVSVAPEGRTEYVLVVTPTEATISSTGTVNLTATIQTWIDGVHDSSQDRIVTTTSSYSTASNLITVSAGVVTGTGQATGGDAIITVTHNDAPNAVTVTIHVTDAPVVTYVLDATPTSVTINYNGTAQITATLLAYVGGVREPSMDIDVTTTSTYQITATSVSGLITVNGNGEIQGQGITAGGNASIQVSHTGASNTVDVVVTVNGASVEEYLEILPAITSTTWDGEVLYQVWYVKEVAGSVDTREQITNANYIVFTLDDGTVGYMNRFTFVAQNISTSQVVEQITATTTAGTHSGLTTRTPAKLTINGASSVVYRLDVEAIPTAITYSGTSQLYASAVTLVDGNVYEWHEATDVVWSEDSSALTIDNNGLATGDNTGTSYVRVVVTGTSAEIGQSGTVEIRVNGRPRSYFNISTDTQWRVDSGAGSCNYYIAWENLKPGTVISFDDNYLDSFSPTSITIDNSNYTGDTVTVVADYSANPNQQSRDIYLYGTAYSLYDQSLLTASDYYRQAAKEEPQPTNPSITVYVNNQVTSAAGGQCGYLEISWQDLDVGTYIDLTGLNVTLPVQSIEVTATTGSEKYNNYPIVAENSGSSRSVSVSGTWRYDSSIWDSENWTQNAAAAGDISVEPDNGTTGSGATSVPFTITWTNLEPNSTITLSGNTAITGITPTSINVGSNTTSSVTITADISENPTTTSRDAILEASGRNNLGSSVSDTGRYTQAAAASVGYISVTPDSGTTGSGDTAASFTVTWTNLAANSVITLSHNSAITGITPTSINVGSNTTSSVTINAYMEINQSSSPKWLILTASGIDDRSETRTDTGSIEQSGADGGVIRVEPDGDTIGSGATSVTFEVYWTNLAPNTNITLTKNSAITSIQPTEISVGDDISSSAAVIANVSANNDDMPRNVILSAVGIDFIGNYPSDSGYCVQAARAEAGSISVTPDGGRIGSGATSVTFVVAWTGLAANSTIQLTYSTGITSISPTSINVGSNITSSVTVTANVEANPEPNERNVALSASGVDARSVTRTDDGYYTQSAAVIDFTLVWDDSEPIACDTRSSTFACYYNDDLVDITTLGMVSSASSYVDNIVLDAHYGEGHRSLVGIFNGSITPRPRTIVLTVTARTFGGQIVSATESVVQPECGPQTRTITLDFDNWEFVNNVADYQNPLRIHASFDLDNYQQIGGWGDGDFPSFVGDRNSIPIESVEVENIPNEQTTISVSISFTLDNYPQRELVFTPSGPTGGLISQLEGIIIPSGKMNGTGTCSLTIPAGTVSDFIIGTIRWTITG